MKTLFLATAAVAAFAAAPALAQSGPVGSIGATYSTSNIDFGPASVDTDNVILDGVVAVPAFSGWTATFAGAADYNTDSDDTLASGTAHLTRMVGSDVRFGGFVGAADLGGDTAYSAGVEAQKYLDKATLTGTVAYTTADKSNADVWTVGGDAAFYAQPNLRLNAGVSYSSVDAGPTLDLWTYGVGAEYEISDTPFSVVAGFTRGDVEDLTIDTWNIGLRYSFGGGLQARDRAGAALPATGINSILSGL